jgi:hypothetical protein
MLDLGDAKWKEFEGGYRMIYNASIPLSKLEKANDPSDIKLILDELWEELHHQGDVGIASYMSVPHLVRIAKEKQLTDVHILGLITVIEIQRHKNNPPLPKEYETAYLASIKELAGLALANINEEWDLETAAWLLSAVAASKGQPSLADAITKMDNDDMMNEFLENN